MNDEALPFEMRRLIYQENKQIFPYQEEIKVINLGNRLIVKKRKKLKWVQHC